MPRGRGPCFDEGSNPTETASKNPQVSFASFSLFLHVAAPPCESPALRALLPEWNPPDRMNGSPRVTGQKLSEAIQPLTGRVIHVMLDVTTDIGLTQW